MDHLIAILSAIAIVGGWMIAILSYAIKATRHVTQINSTLHSLKEKDEEIVQALHDFSKRICSVEHWISKKDRRFGLRRRNDL